MKMYLTKDDDGATILWCAKGKVGKPVFKDGVWLPGNHLCSRFILMGKGTPFNEMLENSNIVEVSLVLV